METRRVSLTFRGGILESLGYSILSILLFLCVIPAAWGATSLLRWGMERIERTDGGHIRFEGRGGQVWPLFIALIALIILPQCAHSLFGRPEGPGFILLLTLVLLPLIAAVKLAIYRWIIDNLRLTPGGQARLTASYGGYLGWLVILNASIFTLVGWAWVVPALLRWLAGSVQGDGYGLEFVGTGWGLLWRAALWTVGILFVIPIPWVLRSVYGWFTDNTVLVLEE